MKKLLIWVKAVRPQSLLTLMAPVMVGVAMAYGDGFSHWPSALTAVIVALCIHIGTNLSNDYYDFISGVDTLVAGRPHSVLLTKELTLDEVRWGFILAFGAAAILVNPLVVRVGVVAVVLLVVAVLVGFWYTAGKWSLARLGLGDAAVLVFFGPVATAGTYYVISFEYNAAVVFAGLMSGFLSTAVLVVNNLRDMTADAQAGRKTLAVRFGKTFTRMEYLFCILASAFIPVLIDHMIASKPLILVCSGFVFLSIPLVHTVFTDDDPRALDRALGMTALLLFIQAVVFGVVWLL